MLILRQDHDMLILMYRLKSEIFIRHFFVLVYIPDWQNSL